MERKLQKLVIHLFFVMLFAGCTTLTDGQKSITDTGTERFQRGLLQRQGEELSFRACDSDFFDPVTHPSAELTAQYDQLSAGMGSALYVEFNGHQDALGRWQIAQLEVAGGGRGRCRERLPGIAYRVKSAAADWVADVADDQIRLRLREQNRTLLFPISGQTGQRQWRSEISADRLYMLELTLSDTGCYAADGTYYSLAARMMLNGAFSDGCARRGELDSRLVAGEYLVQTPQRLIRLVLNRQGDAILQQDYLNDQPMLSDRGRWKRLESGQLMLLLQAGAGRPPRPLLFESHSGVLQQRGFSPDFGQDGLRLYRIDVAN